MNSEIDVLCLCCGEVYKPTGGCPNVNDGAHSAKKAAKVAALLQLAGINQPSPENVRNALKLIR